MRRVLLAIGALLILGGVGALAYHFLPGSGVVPGQTAGTAASQKTNPGVHQDIPQWSRPAQAGYREYHNLAYHFSLFYPDTLSAKEYPGPNSTLTVTFETAAGDQGFQVFITPYGEQQITPERFRMDEPSGVMASSTNVMVGAVSMVHFYGKNSVMGDTVEVWGIYHGFLFEVTSYQPLDQWLGGIMQTWEFI